MTETYLRGIDPGGKTIVHIPLSNQSQGRHATLYIEDYELLKSLGISFDWFAIGQNNVYVSLPYYPHVSVARVLTDAREGQRVVFRDEDGLNLRRTNLYLRRGWSRRHDRQMVRDAVAKKAKVLKAKADLKEKLGL